MATHTREIYRRLAAALASAAMLSSLFVVAPVAAANGDNLRTITADKTGYECSLQTGVAFDGANLLLSCWDNNSILVISPVDGSQVAVHNITGGSGFGALAFDATTGLVWACNMATGSEVGLIDLVADTYTLAFTNSGCIDGLAYDGSDNTIWSSDDAAGTVEHYTKTGTLLSSNATSLGNCGNSGIAVGGANLYLANNGCSEIYTVAKDFSTTTLFASFPARLEDLECDNVSFPGKTAIWSQDAYDYILNAYQIPDGSCDFGGGGGGSAHLTLVKTVDNTGGGTASATDWTLTATGPTTISGHTGDPTITNADVNAGAYALSESGPAGYTASAWDCTGGTLSGSRLVLAADETASCSINNTFGASAGSTFVEILLDRSFSMNKNRGQTIHTYNLWLSAQQQATPDAQASMALFSSCGFHRRGPASQPITDLPMLTKANYQPACRTPLYDSIARTIKHAAKNHLPGDNVMIVVYTDGRENASTHWTRAALDALIASKVAEGWTFVWLGSSPDPLVQKWAAQAALAH